MPNLSIKDVPESLAEQLRQRAARNHRSLQGELMTILENTLRPGVVAMARRNVAPDAARGRPKPDQTDNNQAAESATLNAAQPPAEADSSSRETRIERLKAIAATVNPAFKASERLTRAQVHDRSVLSQRGGLA